MPIHKDWKEMHDEMVSRYGKEKGEEVFIATMKKKKIDYTKPNPKSKSKEEPEQKGKFGKMAEKWDEEDIEEENDDEDVIQDDDEEEEEIDEKVDVLIKEVEQIECSTDVKENLGDGSIIIEGTALRSGVTSGNGFRYPLAEVSKQNLKGVKIFMDHVNEASNVVGKIIESKVEGRNLKFKAKIMNTLRNPGLVEMVKEGLIDAVSIGGSGKEVRTKLSGDEYVNEIHNLKIAELSLVGLAGVPHAKIESVKEAI